MDKLNVHVQMRSKSKKNKSNQKGYNYYSHKRTSQSNNNSWCTGFKKSTEIYYEQSLSRLKSAENTLNDYKVQSPGGC